ncbi:uncharacterized protein LOC133174804 [Saccostrea echinata]|uniref:uncharacterized protein LOC133174804 n=1 Tax=Saccostrea echinata TaxID=191078 RepID=UPI002A7ED8ED|nr:uncharacterized protein LOC133174804 [Saccostrea echinata]
MKRYEQSENRPVQFFLFPKKTPVPKTTFISSILTLITAENEINKKDVIESLGEINITEMGKRKVGSRRLLKMSTDLSKKSVRVTGVRFVDHISCVTSNRMWLSDDNNLILADKKDETICHLTDIDSDIYSYGLHTVSNDGDLIYIDKDSTINKLDRGIKTKFILMNMTEAWKPRCIFCSPFNGDILVGMKKHDADEGKVDRYNSTGKPIQSIIYNTKGRNLYKIPSYVTENHNGDVIVSDQGLEAVIVTDQHGRRRFSYTGPPSGSPLSPRGICTDAFLHIIVCDSNTRTMQMIDKNGHFLEWLRTEQDGISIPCGLCYNDRNHLLMVGSWNSNTVCVYKYIQTLKFLTDN